MTKIFLAGVFLFNQVCFSADLSKYSERDHRIATLELAANLINSTPTYADLFKFFSAFKVLSSEERNNFESFLLKNNITPDSSLPKTSFANGKLQINQFTFDMDQNQQFSYKGIALRKNKTETTEMYIARVANILQGKKVSSSREHFYHDMFFTKAFAEDEVNMAKEVAKGAAIGLAVTAGAIFVVMAAVLTSPILGAVTVAGALAASKGVLAGAAIAGTVAGGAVWGLQAHQKRKIACKKNGMSLQSDKISMTYGFGANSALMLPGVVVSADGKELKKIESLDEKHTKELNHLYQEACVRKNEMAVNEALRTSGTSSEMGSTKSSGSAQ